MSATSAAVSFATLTAAIVLANASVADAPDTSQLHRLAVGKSPSGGPAPTESGHTWRLAHFNRTDQIDAAYRYGNDVIVFGWIGLAGVTTIIDATTGDEKLEFLENDFRITPKGVIVFTRFYPHFSDPSIVSDAVAELDLKGLIPHSVPSQPYENPTDQVGTTIYPEAQTPGIQHDIGHNLLIADGGALLYLVDRLSSGKLCTVRLSLARSVNQIEEQNCTTSGDLGVSDLSEVHVRQFSENAPGDLILGLDIGKPPRSLQRDFAIDKTSLGRSVYQPSAVKQDDGVLRVPWAVQKNGLIVFAPIRILTHEQQSVTARLLIDTAGNVIDVTLTDLPGDVTSLIKGDILKWKFTPTVLNGRPVQVVTEFTSTISGLTNIPD